MWRISFRIIDGLVHSYCFYLHPPSTPSSFSLRFFPLFKDIMYPDAGFVVRVIKSSPIDFTSRTCHKKSVLAQIARPGRDRVERHV